VGYSAHWHKVEMNGTLAPQIFDDRRRLVLRLRGTVLANRLGAPLWEHLAKDSLDRLSIVKRDFARILLIGPCAQILRDGLTSDGREIVIEDLMSGATNELEISHPDASFDLLVCLGTLDSLNDLPGSLVRFRKMLKPDGLLLASFFGRGCLPKLKAAMQNADENRVTPHVHPQIDLRSAADLVTRAGFALPVADIDEYQVRYSNWRRLIDDLRAHGLGIALAGTRHFVGRRYPALLDNAWNELSDDDGKVTENISLIQLSGWAPANTQPKAAKRGSGQISLANILSKS
jgi:NADH dehydrogenase [ubiquinone] 1 alpha subcomplex assembly factor 5